MKPMNNYDPPYKTLFFVCYSTVAAIVATEAGLLGNADSYVENRAHDAFVFGHEWYLVNEKRHPWCGTFLEGEWKVESLVPDRDDGVRFINDGDSDVNARKPRAIYFP